MSTIEIPKTLPRKKQLCKQCRKILHPGDKIVYEERSYHKVCLDEQLVRLEVNKSNDGQKCNDLKSNLTDNNSNEFHEIANDELSLKSFDEKEDADFKESNNEKIIIKVECCNEVSNQIKLNQDENQDENQLKSISSNLSSLINDPLDDEDEKFYEIDEMKSFEKVDQIAVYPKELNPFGEDEEVLVQGEEIATSMRKSINKSINEFISKSKNESQTNYPVELNPFDENDETIEELDKNELKPISINNKTQMPKNYSTSSLERFNNKSQSNSSQQFKSFSNLRANRNSFNQNYDTLSVRSLTPDGKWKSNKKRQAPLPPPSTCQQQQDSSINSSINDTSINNTSSNASSPILDNKKVYTLDKDKIINNETTINHSSQSLSENENSFASLTNSDASESKENITNQQQKRVYKKKNKAPPLPSALLRFVGSIDEIEKECDLIGDSLLVNSNSIREIEIRLQDNHETSKEKLPRGACKKLIYEYFNLIEKKCLLAKRQEELMYLKSQNKLERDQMETDSTLRLLYNKGAKQMTFEDLKIEADLLEKLVDIIERKNEIEENIITIDKRKLFKVEK